MTSVPAATTGGRATVRRRALPLLAAYWSFGQFWGVFTILLLEFQSRHALSDAQVGLHLMLLSIVAIVSMLVIAPRMQPWPLARSTSLALATLGVGSLAFGTVSTWLLPLAALLVGAGNAFIDIYLNVAAQRAEVEMRRPVLQWLHACYALGGMTGAAVAGVLRTAGVDFRWGFAYVGLALAVTAAWNARTAPRDRRATEHASAFSLAALFRTPFLWIPALALLGAFLVEGSLDVWAGLYLREELGASALVAAGAFMAFSGAAFVGRLFAGRVLFGLGRRATIVISGVGSGVAGLVAVLTDSPTVVAVAFLVLGFALSAAAPAGFGLVEEARDEDPGAAIAGVTTIGYSGFVWSPVVIGAIAGAWGLRMAMGFIVACTLAIVVAGLLAPRDRPEVTRPG